MRRFFSVLVCTGALAACSDSLPVEQTRAPRLNAVSSSAPSRYVIQLSPSATAEAFARGVASLGGKVEAFHKGAGFAVVEGLSSANAAKLARERGVQAVEPDLVAQVVAPAFRPEPELGIEATDVGAASQARPDLAAGFPRQWNLRAIGAPTAWTAGRRGSASVTVAILDSGIDDTYLDLAGLVDRARSASFLLPASTVRTPCWEPTDHELINGRAAYVYLPPPPAPAVTCPALPAFHLGKPPWADLNGHGTYTGGIVSSKAVVFAGVTSNVTLMAVKVIGAKGSGSFSAILQGVAFATDNGADVINMSLGAVFARHGGYIGFLNTITRYAHSRGVTIVVASGNDGLDLDHSGGAYAAFCSSGMVICVSATGPVLAVNNAGIPSVNGPRFLPTPDEPAIYSNYGTSSVDVAAPGGNYVLDLEGKLVSAVYVWGGCSSTTLLPLSPPKDSPPGTPAPFPYYGKTCHTPGVWILRAYGTSAAAPHVSGLAALLVENLGRRPGQIRTTIQQTADDLGKSGADPHYGKGRINVPQALGL